MKHPRKKKILKVLHENPIISSACIQIGISRQTFYRWREEDVDFNREVQQVINIGTDAVNDLAESALINNIKKGTMPAIRFWLSNNHKNYIQPRKSVDWGNRKGTILGNKITFVGFGNKPDE
jgi:uncharacterized protein involved in tolerance to divalent cations